jgi:HlyD family secretion protein
MANSKKRRKIFVFSAIGLVVAGLALGAIFKKRQPMITVQIEKVARRNLTELVVANGKIQPVVQVKISAEVSGEITALPLKEGDCVQKGAVLVKIKPDFYIANRNQAEAAHKSSLAAKTTAQATLERAEAEFKRNKELFDRKLVSDSTYIEFKTGRDIAAAQLVSADDQVEMSKASLASAEEELAKTTIVSPLSGTVSKLNSQLGERVLGTVQNVGTEIMRVADLNEMEARVDIGEIDVVLIKPGQNVRLEVDAFKDRKFKGTVTEIANSAKNLGYGDGSQQDATKFEVKIHINDKEAFRPGMSVTAEIETRSRTNALTVPIASVTARLPKEKDKDTKPGAKKGASHTNSATAGTNVILAVTNSHAAGATNLAKADRKSKEAPKPIEVVFVKEGDHAKMVPVKMGISDDSYWEITEGLQEGQEVISGGYRAIGRDLEDGKKIKLGPAAGEKDKDKPKDGEEK